MPDIDLFGKDNPFERARKAWKLLGISAPPMHVDHAVGKLAEIFMAYKDLDRKDWEAE